MSDDLGESEQRLSKAAERIERLVKSPADIADGWTSLAAPVMRALKWEPELRTDELRALLFRRTLSSMEADLLRARSVAEQFERAVKELERNVSQMERAQLVYARIPMAYASWLHRLHQLLTHARAAIGPEAGPPRSRLLDNAELMLAAPLVARGSGEVVHVGAIDPLIRAADSETQDLGRRRRLLEAARELLLESGAALQIDAQALAVRRQYIARSIARIQRYQAAGLKTNVGLVHQLRRASEQRDAQRLHAALSALDEVAGANGDDELAELAARGLDTLSPHRDRFGAEARAESLARSGAEVFEPAIHRAMRDGFARAPERIAVLRQQAGEGKVKDVEVDLAEASLRHDVVAMTLRAALAVDGCFDVGGVLSPVRVVEAERRRRLVRFPTQHLVLAPAKAPEEIPHAVIEDPRTVLLSLATGRLLARNFATDELRKRERIVLRNEVRVYVLDGSASMLGPRAYMRDAVLIAELSTLIARRRELHRTLDPVLYYRYFTRELGELQHVKNEEEALKAIESVLASVQIGGTDIEKALLASLELVARARRDDPELARAQIVLVTDGEAPVSSEKILAAREQVADLPIGISIIALGVENPALRDLAAAQRARGERIFYHFTSDAELEAFVDGRAFGLPIHAPQSSAEQVAALDEIVNEIEAYGRRNEEAGLAQARDHQAALEEMGLSLERDFGEGERALHAARARDERTLERRFERWFGRLESSPPSRKQLLFEPPPQDQGDLDLVVTLLLSVSEVVDVLGSDALTRQADAIDVFERLLVDAGMAPSRYAQLCERYPGSLRTALAGVRAAVRGALPPEGDGQEGR